MWREPFGHAGEAAQVGEHHHCVGAHLGRGKKALAELGIFEDLIREPGRDVAPESPPQHLLAPLDFRLELGAGHLAPQGARTHQGLDSRFERLVRRHRFIPKFLVWGGGYHSHAIVPTTGRAQARRTARGSAEERYGRLRRLKRRGVEPN